MNILEQKIDQQCQRDAAGRRVYFPKLSKYGYVIQNDADFGHLVEKIRRGRAANLIILGLCLAVPMWMFDGVRLVMATEWDHLIKPVLGASVAVAVYFGVRTMTLRSFAKSDLVFTRRSLLEYHVMAARTQHFVLPLMLWVLFWGLVWVTWVQWTDPIGVRVTNGILLACVLGAALYFTYLMGLAAGLKAQQPRN